MNCVICYQTITHEAVTCPVCKNSCHADCWDAMIDKSTCPICRCIVFKDKLIDHLFDTIDTYYVGRYYRDAFDEVLYLRKLFNSTFNDNGVMKSYILDILNDDCPFRLTDHEEDDFANFTVAWEMCLRETGAVFEFPFAIEEWRFMNLERTVNYVFLDHIKYEDLYNAITENGEIINVKEAWNAFSMPFIQLLLKRYDEERIELPCSSDCKHKNRTSYSVKTKFQRHRLNRIRSKKIDIFYCKDCCCAYCGDYEVDPPFDEIKDKPLTFDSFKYDRRLLCKLLKYKHMDKRVIELVRRGRYDAFEFVKRILFSLWNTPAKTIASMSMRDVIMITRKITTPAVILEEFEADIIDVANGADISQLNNLFRLL